MKKKVLISIGLIIMLGIISVGVYFTCKERKIIVFAYHKVVPQEIKDKYYKDDPWIDTTERFQEQMKYLYDHGYKTISMSEYEEWRKSQNKKLPIKTVMLTIDDGDIQTYYEMLPILKKYKFKATSFIIGEKITDISDKYDPTKKQFLGRDLIEKIKKEYPNLEIQSHSFGLHNRSGNIPYVLNMSKEEIENDFNQMDRFNTNIYCYPYGVHNNTILEVLEKKNYRMAFKLDESEMSSKKDNKFLIKRVGINYNTSFSNFKKWLLKQIIF